MTQLSIIKTLRHFFLDRGSPIIESDDIDLVDAGVLDSLALIELLLHIETTFNVQIPIHEIEIDDLRSLSNVAALVDRRLNIAAEASDGSKPTEAIREPAG